MAEMPVPTESSPPRRWFQFDLRTLFVVLTALAVIFALELRHLAGPKRAKQLADVLKLGDFIRLGTRTDETKSVLYVIADQPLSSHTYEVIEINEEFISLESTENITHIRRADIVKIVRYLPVPPEHDHGHAAAIPGVGTGGFAGDDFGGRNPRTNRSTD